MRPAYYLIAIVLLALSATSFAQQAPFSDMSESAGINNTGRNYGVAFGDFDNDGREDIYISRHFEPNLLYRSLGNGQFVDVAASAGVASADNTTVSGWGDINNDGFLDLYLGNRSTPNTLYLNNGDGTFQDISESAGVNSGYLTRAVLFGDVDRDGFVDLYVANMNAPNFLYHNNGDNTFTDITVQANAEDFGVAMGSLFFDYDNDGDLDLYLTHDANQPNILYMNNGDGTFTDTSPFSGANIAAQGMGVDIGDVNNDGFLDLYITNLYSNELLINDGDGTFSLITETAGVGDMGMGWGTVWLDYDNDGLQDIYMSNDSYFTPFPNILYRNKGDQTFEIVSEGTPLESMFGGYGVAAADVNDDGLVDLLQANSGTNDGNQLFINDSQNDNNWIKFRLKGTVSNSFAIGAKVTALAGDIIHTDEVCAGSSYASQNSFHIHFGLGEQAVLDEVHIRWPNGLEETYYDLAVNQLYNVTEGEGLVSNTNSLTQAAIAANLSPNPVKSGHDAFLDIQLDRSTAVQLQLLNASGQLLYAEQALQLGAGQHQLPISTTSLSKGLVFVQLDTDYGSVVRKMLVLE
jgi:hypothetical protein